MVSLLETIQSPAQVRELPRDQLAQLAAEIRSFMITVVSQHGGHLASSLGTVELTLALHYTYQTPQDKIVWDVGHQAYAHKIITGRRDRFQTLREFEGISGFPRISESEYDALSVGHASTSISAALGMAAARDLLKTDQAVVAVIGDGSMSGGLAFEGLNNLGSMHTRMAVVLNDNEMSISRNVGALSSYFTRVLTDKRFNRIKKDVWELLGNLSHVGKGIRSLVHNVDDALKHFVIPGKLFEDLGLRYLGPVDGHNIAEMIEVFEYVRNHTTDPVLVHVLTKKGKGYQFAEKDATRFHGIGKFSPQTGTSTAAAPVLPSYSDVFGTALTDLGRTDKKVVAITAAMPDGTGLTPFREAFPERFFDVGIAEGHAVTFAAGLARQGLKPVVALYSTFLQRAYDQIVHDIALDRLPVVFCIDRAGLVGEDGPTHHGALDISYLRCVPNVSIIAPRDGQELRNALCTALNQSCGPVFIRYPRGTAEEHGLDAPFAPFTDNRPVTLRPAGDTVIVSVGTMAAIARQALEILEKDGISCGHIDARWIKPFDRDFYLDLMRTTRSIVTLENNALAGGFGSSLLELANENKINVTIDRIGYPDEFITHGSINILHERLGLTGQAVAERIRRVK